VLAIKLQSVAATNYYRCARKLSTESCDIRNQLAKYKNQSLSALALVLIQRTAKSLNI
jgi:flagellar basal body-associated protein FliL